MEITILICIVDTCQGFQRQLNHNLDSCQVFSNASLMRAVISSCGCCIRGGVISCRDADRSTKYVHKNGMIYRYIW